jgi:hypothetical protein
MQFTRFQEISIARHPSLNEYWVQDTIAEEPAILGLGDLLLKDKERPQIGAGRLDLLLQDADGACRYEVEIQLGANDPSHIIRTIEYWDLERKRYPQYEHTAVLVAEDITSRFLNVIGLFNGSIPFVAIQMKALECDGKVGLVFTKVLDQVQLGLVDDDEEIQQVADREYWLARASRVTVEAAEKIIAMASDLDVPYSIKYTKGYIAPARGNRGSLFILLRPMKGRLQFRPKLSQSDEVQQLLDNSGIPFDEYRNGRYRILMDPEDVTKYDSVLRDLIARSLEQSRG